MATGEVPDVMAFTGPRDEAGADIKDTLAAYFLTLRGHNVGD